MTDPRPLRLRDEGPPNTDILAADGRLLITVYPEHYKLPDYRAALPDRAIRSNAEAEAIAAEIVQAYNAYGWHPITKDSPAPRGRDVLLFERFHDGHHWIGVDEIDEDGNCLGADATPSHWAELLPVPPAEG